MNDDLQRLAEAQRPDDEALDRLERRVEATLARRRPDLRLVGAAALLLAGLAWWGRLDRAPVEVALLEPGVFAVAAGVQATAEGQGTATVSGEETRVRWTEGTVALEVERAPGRSVTIETDEATVRVIGTGLRVERGTFGTTVEVSHGVVVVTCAGLGEDERLEVGDRTECFRDAGTAVGRVLWLEGHGASARQRLGVIERALRYPSAVDATREVLVERRIDALADLGRDADAVAAVLDLPEEDRVARWTAGAAEAMAGAGCARAAPWLAALEEARDATGALLRVQCLAPTDPAGARAVLERIAGWPLTPEQARATADWRAALR